MATQYFKASVYGEGYYKSVNMILGTTINALWNILNLNSDNRSVWGTDANGWVQYRSAFNTYAGRYHPDNLTLGDTYFETQIQPSGTGNAEVGFFMRYKDNFSFYYLSYNGGWKNWNGNNIRLVKVAGTSHLVVKEFACPVFNRSQIYQFRCEMVGNNIKIYLDGNLIIDYTDLSTAPYLTGAFGPWVAGQEYAKWDGFKGEVNTFFSVIQDIPNQNIAQDVNSAALSQLLVPDTVSTLLEDEYQAVVAGKTVLDRSWSRFSLSDDNTHVFLVFDQIDSRNVTTDPNAKIYVYQDYIPMPPSMATNPQLMALDSTTIKLTWDHPDDTEDGFYVLDENDTIIATLGAGVGSYIETNLTENVTYYRKIRAFNATGNAGDTMMVSVTTPRTIPSAPLNLTGTPISDTEIDWRWEDTSFNEDSFELIEWDVTGNPVVVAILLANQTGFIETGLTASTMYTRAVRARNTAGISGISNTYAVTTKAERIDPPTAPSTFYGIGISDSQVAWYWTDTSNNESGFELLDKDDRVIAILPPNIHTYTEEGLYAGMFYHRKLRAFNEAGRSPMTGLYTARTLQEGEVYVGVPDPVLNARVEIHSMTEASVWWDYIPNPDFIPDGFKIYSSEGLLFAAVPYVEGQSEFFFRFTALQPNTTYRFFVTTYNANGNSKKSNAVIFVTPGVVLTPPEPEIPQELEEPFEQVHYDEETVDTGKISAFQSGVGDHLDLFVANLYNVMPSLERFKYTMYIKGYYNETLETYHPQVDFRFRITTTGTQYGEPYERSTDWIVTSVNGQSTDTGVKDLIYPIRSDIPADLEMMQFSVEVRDAQENSISLNDPNASVQWFLNYSGTETTSQADDFITFQSTVTSPKTIKRSWRSPEVEGGPIDVYAGSEQLFTKYIRCANLNAGWRDDIYGYKMVITSQNPNVDVILEREIVDYLSDTDSDSTFIEVALKARIVNETQTLWYPSIHSGHYYLNQQEHYLFVDDRVRPRDGDIDETYVLQFPYTIKAYGKRTYLPADVSYTDTEKSDFLQGEVTAGVSLDKITGAITLADNVTKAGYLSRMLKFGNPVESWFTLDIDQDDQAIADGAKLRIEVAPCDETGHVNESDWRDQIPGQLIDYPIDPVKPIEQIRYRLTFEEGYKREDYTFEDNQNAFSLRGGYMEYTESIDSLVQIKDVTHNPEGIFITQPVNLGDKINSLGTVQMEIEEPYGATLRVYSVMGTSDTDPDLYNPIKWSRLTRQPLSGNLYEFTINSPYTDSYGVVDRTWLALVFEMVRGKNETTEPILINSATFDPSVATNLHVSGGLIRLIDETSDGWYRPAPIELGNATAFNNVVISLAETYEGDEILIDTLTGDTEEDVLARAKFESEWKRVSGATVMSVPKPWLLYRIRIIPGMINRRIAVFQDDTRLQWESHSNRSNVDIIDDVDAYLKLSSPRTAGSYVSEAFDLGFIDHLYPFHMRGTDLEKVKLFASQKVNNIWQSEVPITFDAAGDGAITYTKGATHLRYRLDIQPIVTVQTYSDVYSEAKLETGAIVSSNIQINADGSMQLIDPSLNDVYLSPTFDAVDVIQYRQLAINKTLPASTAVVIEVATSDTDTWDMATWFAVAPDGTFSVTRRRYLRFKITLVGSSDGAGGFVSPIASDITLIYDRNAYSSPTIQEVVFSADQYDKKSLAINSIQLSPVITAFYSPTAQNIVSYSNLYRFVRKVPTVYSLTLGGHIAGGEGIENYYIDMLGEIISDGKLRDVTGSTVAEIVSQYLADQGIDNGENLAFTDYLLEWDEAMYPVELYTNTNGAETVKAKTTAKAGEVLYRHVRVYFDETNRGTVLKPVPQVGSPIVIKNASGRWLRQVHFRDTEGNPTLTNLEWQETNETRYLFTEYRGIDPFTLEVYMDFQNNGTWTQIFNCQVEENRILLDNLYEPGIPVKILYKLMDSYFVDYNYAPLEEACLIRVHTGFDPTDKETRRLYVQYEVEKKTPYYIANEINLNPLKTRLNAGFIYLTDKLYPPYKIELDFNPNMIYKSREERVSIQARVVDEFSNPIVGRKVRFMTSVGSIQIVGSSLTDENGIVTAMFSTSGLAHSPETTAVITVIEESTRIQRQSTIYLLEEEVIHKLAIISEKRVVQLGDDVQLKVIAMGPNNERMVNRSILLTVSGSHDTTTPLWSVTGRTNIHGEMTATYSHTKEVSGTIPFLVVEAESVANTSSIQQQILLSISGV